MDSDDDRVEVGQLDRHIPVPEWKRRTNATINKYNCPRRLSGLRTSTFVRRARKTDIATDSSLFIFCDFFIITFAVC